MIEITAKLVREQTPVFLCGEQVECFISLTNPSLPEHKIAQSHNDILENLAWASAQIHCYCNSTIQEKNDEFIYKNYKNETSLNTALEGQGNTIYASNPKILFCDLRLAPGEIKSFLYKEKIPLITPPTYRGLSIKYFYKLTIATQRVNSKVQILRVPIRVLPLPSVIQPDDLIGICNETTEELAPSNPFLEKKKTESKLEIALQHMQNVTARRRPNFYVISNKRGKVGRFCLFKPAYKLGEDIVGTLDFTSRTVHCIQISVTLQCEEILLKNNEQHSSNSDGVTGKIMNYTKHHEVCLGLIQTQVILPIPLHVTPTFKTDLVELKWRLHFEFVTSINSDLNVDLTDKNDWMAPSNIDIETMIWNLPVVLYPTAPLQIPQQTEKHSLIIK